MQRARAWISVVLGGAIVMVAAPMLHAENTPSASEIAGKKLDGGTQSGKLQKGERLPPAGLTTEQIILSSPENVGKQDQPSEGADPARTHGQGPAGAAAGKGIHRQAG